VVSALKPFRRNKIPEDKKIRAVELYLKGLSYRQLARSATQRLGGPKIVERFTGQNSSQLKNREVFWLIKR